MTPATKMRNRKLAVLEVRAVYSPKVSEKFTQITKFKTSILIQYAILFLRGVAFK
jgi:hypothetical protein